MLTIRYQTAFKKDYKRIVRRGYDVRLLEEVITILAEQRPLPEIYRGLYRMPRVPYNPRLAPDL